MLTRHNCIYNFLLFFRDAFAWLGVRDEGTFMSLQRKCSREGEHGRQELGMSISDAFVFDPLVSFCHEGAGIVGVGRMQFLLVLGLEVNKV
jgi:hypothetical protein